MPVKMLEKRERRKKQYKYEVTKPVRSPRKRERQR